MVLNNNPQMFSIYFPSNWFYKEVVEKWTPIIEKMRLPYMTLDDFMNAQIQTFELPGFSLDIATQQRNQYEVGYAQGKELEPVIEKSINITFKLTESYISYFILWDQIDTYLHYNYLHETARDVKPIWMEPIKVGFLSDGGLQLLEFSFEEIVPRSLTNLNMSYAATIASYSTFTLGLHYNRFDIK